MRKRIVNSTDFYCQCILTKIYTGSKIQHNERRFTLDPKNWKAEIGESEVRTTGNFYDPRRTERGGRGSRKRQGAAKEPCGMDHQTVSRYVTKNQEIKKGSSSYRGKYRTTQRNTGLRQRTLFIVAFLLPLSSHFQLR